MVDRRIHNRGTKIGHSLKPSSKPSNKERGWSNTWYVGWCLIIGGIVLIQAEVIRYRSNNQASDSWNEYACTVIHSRVVSPRRFYDELHRAAVDVRYYEGSTTYSGEVSGLSAFSGRDPNANGGYVRDRAEQQRIIDKYPVGLQRTCFVDPKNRKKIVFEFDTQIPWIGFIGGILMLVLGGLLVTVELRGRTRGP